MGLNPSFFVEKIRSRNKINFHCYALRMSREEFKNFVKAVEHNMVLKEKLSQCKTSKDLILLAKKHRFSVTLEDSNHDTTASKFEIWFKESRINPLK